MMIRHLPFLLLPGCFVSPTYHHGPDAAYNDTDASLVDGQTTNTDSNTDGQATNADGQATCTTIVPTLITCGVAGPVGYDKPAYYFENLGMSSCIPLGTSAGCQCQETYHCACVMQSYSANQGCTCNDSTGTVFVTCP